MTQKFFRVEYYTNLYKLASQLTNPLLKSDKPIIIVSNCLSLIAGLTFNAIKQSKMPIHVLNKFDNSILEVSENSLILIALSENDFANNKELQNIYTFYFKYEGHEDNILCLE